MISDVASDYVVAELSTNFLEKRMSVCLLCQRRLQPILHRRGRGVAVADRTKGLERIGNEFRQCSEDRARRFEDSCDPLPKDPQTLRDGLLRRGCLRWRGRYVSRLTSIV